MAEQQHRKNPWMASIRAIAARRAASTAAFGVWCASLGTLAVTVLFNRWSFVIAVVCAAAFAHRGYAAARDAKPAGAEKPHGAAVGAAIGSAVWVLLNAVTMLAVVVAAVCGIVVVGFIYRAGTEAGRPSQRGFASHYRADGKPKVAYRNERLATKAASEFEGRTGEKMNAYQCSECPEWHIGHAT